MQAEPNNKYVLDRQVRIEDWDQKKLEEQTVFILGIGGLGTNLAINLLRLGIKKLIMVDYDTVDIHNLNRQILFTKEDVGKSKAEQAKKNLEFHNINDTDVETYNFDAVKKWDKVIEIAKRANFVYNCIDYGEYYDVAVQSLCLALEIPFAMGGTFSSSLSVDFFKPKGAPCYLCLTQGIKKEMIEKLDPSKILTYDDISFIPKDNNPVGQSTSYLCSACADFMTSFLTNYLFAPQLLTENPKRVMFYLNGLENMKFDAETEYDCPFCARYDPESEQKLAEQKKKRDIEKAEYLKKLAEDEAEEKKKKEEEEAAKKKAEEESKKEEGPKDEAMKDEEKPSDAK